MIHLTARIRCPNCSHAFTVYVPAEDKADADSKLDPRQRYVIRCPSNNSLLHVYGGVLRPVDEPPARGVTPVGIPALLPEPAPPQKPWWRFW
jgi:hypothetical protein